MTGDYTEVVLETLAFNGLCNGDVLFSVEDVVATVRAELRNRRMARRRAGS